jgi:hypothetical protein
MRGDDGMILKMTLRYPANADMLGEAIKWTRLGFAINHHKDGLMDVSEIENVRSSLKEALDSAMAENFKSLGVVIVNKNW